MKNSAIKLAILILGLTISLSACKKKTNTITPAVSKEIKIADLADKYFIIQKNEGRLLGSITFINEGGGLKFYYDAAGMRRIGAPIVENVDSAAGTATANIDLDGNGLNVYKFSLKKLSDGTIYLMQSEFKGLTTNISSASIHNVKDLEGFSFTGLNVGTTINSNGNSISYSYVFSSTTCTYSRTGYLVQTKGYYALNGNVGFKVDDTPLFGVVWKKTSGKYGILINNYPLSEVIELEK